MVILTNSDGGEEHLPTGRNRRLSRVFDAAEDMLSRTTPSGVFGMDDHKGRLRVTWRDWPAIAELFAFQAAWNAESEEWIEFAVLDYGVIAHYTCGSHGIEFLPQAKADCLAAEQIKMAATSPLVFS